MASIATFNPHAFDCTPPKQVVYPSKPSQRHVYPSQAPPSSPTASAPRSAVLWRTPDLARPIKKVKMAPLASTSSVVSQSLSQSDPKIPLPASIDLASVCEPSTSKTLMSDPVVFRTPAERPAQPVMRNLAERSRHLVREGALADVDSSYSFPKQKFTRTSSFCTKLSRPTSSLAPFRCSSLPFRNRARLTSSLSTPDRTAFNQDENQENCTQPLWLRRGKPVPSLSFVTRKRKQQS